MNNLFIEISSIKTKKDNIIKKDGICITKSTYKNNKYTTIEFNEINNKLENIVIDNLKDFFYENNIRDTDKALVVGLGNYKCTCDSLGCKVVDNIIVSDNIKELGFKREVVTFTPSVKGKTGIETRDVIKSIFKSEKPDFIVIIDSLKTNNISRLNKTIEITDSGIKPGSGVDNNRKAITSKTLGVPVIVIGVPLVCDIKSIAKEDIEVSDMIVSTKDIDFVVDYISKFLAIVINKVLYRQKK